MQASACKRVCLQRRLPAILSRLTLVSDWQGLYHPWEAHGDHFDPNDEDDVFLAKLK